MPGAWIFAIALFALSMTSFGQGLAFVLGSFIFMISSLVWMPFATGPGFSVAMFWVHVAIFVAAVGTAIARMDKTSFSIENNGTIVFLSLWGYVVFGQAILVAPHGRLLPRFPGFS